jgi:hypothetical protein
VLPGWALGGWVKMGTTLLPVNGAQCLQCGSFHFLWDFQILANVDYVINSN